MASVRIENDAWTDPRYALLAELCELPDPRFALVLCASVWSYCTDRNEDVLSESLVDALAKHKGFARKMVEASLADETKRGFRIKGARGRIEWLASKRKNAAKGGKQKAENRLANASEPPSSSLAAVLPSAPAPAPAPALTQAKREEREETEAIASGEARAPRSTKPRVVSWRRAPADFKPSADTVTLAATLGVNLAAELEKFRDHEFAKPKTDVEAAFRTWLRNASQWSAPARPANGNGRPVRGAMAPVSKTFESDPDWDAIGREGGLS